MTDFDVHPYQVQYDASAARHDALKDMRLDRDAQKDLHEAIDLAYAFAGAIKALHPLAERQVKAMIFQGNLL